MDTEKAKGLERTYGRGAGEREFRRIPMARKKKRPTAVLYDPAHAKWPQSGGYAGTPDKSEK